MNEAYGASFIFSQFVQTFALMFSRLYKLQEFRPSEAMSTYIDSLLLCRRNNHV